MKRLQIVIHPFLDKWNNIFLSLPLSDRIFLDFALELLFEALTLMAPGNFCFIAFFQTAPLCFSFITRVPLLALTFNKIMHIWFFHILGSFVQNIFLKCKFKTQSINRNWFSITIETNLLETENCRRGRRQSKSSYVFKLFTCSVHRTMKCVISCPDRYSSHFVKLKILNGSVYTAQLLLCFMFITSLTVVFLFYNCMISFLNIIFLKISFLIPEQSL